VGKLVTVLIIAVIIAIIITVLAFIAIAAVAGVATSSSAGLSGPLAAIVGTTAAGVKFAGTLITTLLSVGIIAGGVVGGFYYNTAQVYSTQVDTVTFTPTCDQTINIQKFQHHGSGLCIPSGSLEVDGADRVYGPGGYEMLLEAGQPQPIQAVTKKCSGWRSKFCGKCRTTCTTQYR
jgi:hypothetical protein